MATTKLWTIEEIEQLPDDEFQHAVIRGVHYRMPPPGYRHGRVVMAIGAHLHQFIQEHGLGEITDQSGYIFERDPDTLLGPDLAFVSNSRLPADERVYPEVVPELIVEVRSPAQTGPSIEETIAVYLVAGVRLIWVIDPERHTVQVHRGTGRVSHLTEIDELSGEDVLPGFTLPVSVLFR